MLIKYFRFIFYLVVYIGYSSALAGSYDDFFKAIKEDNPVVLSNLMNRGFDVNTISPQGEYALILAFREPRLKAARVLIGWPNLNAEVRSAQDESPLMLAALHGLLAECQGLIERGADVNKPGWAPLHYAATNGHLVVMQLLIDENAYLDAESPNGSTPLMMAAHYGTPSAVKLLLESGADPTLKNNLGLSAIDFAHQANRLESAAIIGAFIRGRHPKESW
jgi:ankyrin repeat protein